MSLFQSAASRGATTRQMVSVRLLRCQTLNSLRLKHSIHHPPADSLHVTIDGCIPLPPASSGRSNAANNHCGIIASLIVCLLPCIASLDVVRIRSIVDNRLLQPPDLHPLVPSLQSLWSPRSGWQTKPSSAEQQPGMTKPRDDSRSSHPQTQPISAAIMHSRIKGL